MRLILILLVSLGGSLALAVDPTLVRQSFGKCYYDDGSVISSNTCPSRLRLNAGRSENPYKINGMTEDSREWRREFGRQRNEGLQQGMSAIQFAIEKRRIELAKEKEKEQSGEYRKNAAFADYVSEKYGQEGESLRSLIMSGVIDSTNYQLFLD